jgi:hypothetical protein
LLKFQYSTYKGEEILYKRENFISNHEYAFHKFPVAKALNITPVLGKIQEYRRKLLQQINRIPYNRLSIILNKTTEKKKPKGTFKQTSRRVRLEGVNKWPNSVLAR